jgi:hypothetical protein
VGDVKVPVGVGEAVGVEAGSVVGQNASGGDVETLEPSHRLGQEALPKSSPSSG